MDSAMQRNTALTGFGPGEHRSVLASMLSKSFSEFTAAESEFHSREAAMGEDSTPNELPNRTPSKSPSKGRSLSDSTPKLSPSPKIKERLSKDDHNLASSLRDPKTPRRPDFLQRGLSLQMPSGDLLGIQSPTSFSRAPLSPQLTKSTTYGSPAKVLPRHSRGLDFSRACTNLHHSTLAEQSSPDSSPTINQKGVMIPHRKMSMNTMALDPPQFAPWSQTEKSMVSSSLGSVNMFDSESSSSSDEGADPMEPDDHEDAILTTPQVAKRHNPSASTPFSGPAAWPGANFPGASSFTNFHRQRLRNGRSRKSSSSASGHSNMASPVPTSPPNGKNEGYFGREVTMRGSASRRESLSMHTHDLHISSGNDSGDEATRAQLSTPGVIRRAVTRRGNLLPKIRALGRVRDELMEESMPVDAEVKREAEVIRQVRESDTTDTNTAHSSPTLQAVNSLSEALQGIPEDNIAGLDGEPVAGFTPKGLFGTFGRQESRSGTGKDFWNNHEHRTPPPPMFFPRGSSSTVSDDASMDSPTASAPPNSAFPWVVPTREQTPVPPAATAQFQAPAGVYGPISAADGLRKVNKRRRDDDLDMQSIKRRAVSPGVSVGNSPILSQSPSQRSENLWGQPKHGRSDSVSGNASGERSNSNGSVSQTPLLGPKRIGLQGINDMQGMAEKMSIE